MSQVTAGYGKSKQKSALQTVRTTLLAFFTLGFGVVISGVLPLGSSAASTVRSTTPVNGGDITYGELPGQTPDYIFPMYPPADNTNANTVTFQYLIHPPMYFFVNGANPTFNESLSLAKAPVYSANDTSVTVNLKHWKWSNGEALDATDVLFWMNMLKADQTGWGNFSPGDIPDNLKNVVVDSKYTLTFTMTRSFDPTWFTYNELAQITPMPVAWDVASKGAKPGSGGCSSASFASVTYNPTTYAPVSASAKACNAVYNYLSIQSGYNPTNPSATNTASLASFATNPLWRIVDGPWYLSSFQSTGYAVFTRNPSYGGAKPYADKLTTLPFTSDTAEYAALQAGSIDYGYLPLEDVTSVPSKPGEAGPNVSSLSSSYNLKVSPSWSVGEIIMNFNSTGDGGAAGKLFQQLYVRQAIQTLIDQPVYVKKIFHNYAHPIYGPVPPNPSTWAASSELVNPYPYNEQKAASLLSDHGWKVVSGGSSTCERPGSGSNECGAGIKKGTPLNFKIEFPSGTATVTSMMQDQASSWRQVGIDVSLSEAGANAVFAYTTICPKGCAWEMGFYGAPSWFFGGSDTLPTGESLWNTGGGANYGSFNSPETNTLINETNEVPQGQFKSVFAQYQGYLAKELPAFWEPNPENLIEVKKNLNVGVLSPLAEINPASWYFVK